MKITRFFGGIGTQFLAAALMALSLSLTAATFVGPTPYLSFTNSPFNGLSFQYFYLETFEDGSLNTPGVTANGGVVAQPSTGTDSVDADDGVIDGFGRNGHSWYSQYTHTNFTFTFNTNVLGRWPTHAGVVYTDSVGGFLVSFEAYDATGNSLGRIGPFTLGVTNQNTGETDEDRFFGVVHSNGISAIKITCNDTDWEIDHLQYGRALDPAPATNCVTPPSGLVAWWTGNGTALDQVGNNHGVMTNGATYTNGLVGQSFWFDGTNDQFQAATVGLPSGSSDRTMEMWFRPDRYVGGFDWIAGYMDNIVSPTYYKSYCLGWYQGRVFWSSWGGIITGGPTTVTGQWYHVAVASSNSFTRLYLNGVEIANNDSPTSGGGFSFNTPTNSVMLIGNGPNLTDVTRRFNGAIDEVSVYNRALSSNEIMAIYTAGAMGKCGPQVPPAITSLPMNLTIGLGDPIAIQVGVSGSYPLSFQWLFNGTNITGATRQQLIISAATLDHSGNYSVIVSNAFGMITGLVASVSVQVLPPAITTQPANQVVVAGGNATFTVAASGSPPKVYQWRFNGTDLPEATNATLVLVNVTTNQAGNYAALVSNAADSVLSSNAVLTVVNPATGIFDDFEPGIDLAQWSAFGGTVGSTVLATNYGGWVSPSNSLWFGDGVSRFAATRVLNTSAGGLISFYLRFGSGSMTPWERADLPMEGVVLEFSTNGTAWTEIGRYNTTNYYAWTLVTTNIPTAAQGYPVQFRWRQLTFSGAVSDHWALDDVMISTTPMPPIIGLQPINQTIILGDAAALEVGASGSPPLSYQWQLNGSDVPGATNSRLVLNPVGLQHAGAYVALVRNPYGVATSAVATLTVTVPACVTPPSGLVGWWAAEGNTADNTGGTNAALLGGATFAPGKVGQAFSFDGIDDEVRIPASSNLNVASLTFEGWIYPYDISRAQPLVDYLKLGVANGVHLWISLNSSGNSGSPVPGSLFGNVMTTSGANNIIFSAGAGIPSNRWTHVAMTYDQASGTAKLYVNGASVATANFGSVIPKTDIPIGLGARETIAHYSGRMDEFAVYNRALSAAEIQAIVSASYAGKCGPQIPPSLVGAPTNLIAGLGEPLTLQAAVSGTPPFAFQWLFNGTNLDGATSQQLVIPSATMADAGEYSVIVSNAYGSATGVVANVSVLILPPAIVTQPVSQTRPAGSNATFNVVASGTPPKTYQWYFNGAVLADATNTTLVLPSVILANQGQYWVVVENTEGVATSAVATLTVVVPPAKVQLPSPTVPSGVPSAVPVFLVANGNENALQFSVSYFTNLVAFLDATPGAATTNAILFVNNSLFGSGRVGITLALPAGQTFPAGTQEVVRLNFMALMSTNTNTMALGFSDGPIARQLVDVQAQVLSANYTGGIMTILPADFEADVAPRGVADHRLSVADLVQIGRFVAGLDALSSAAEFQRADCAPRSDGGNGVLSVSDWVQAGRYAALIDPLQVASGPTEPVTVPGLVRADLQPRNDGGNACTVTVAEASLKLGETNRLAILLTADGTACAIGFVLNYDSNQLSFVSGSLAQTYPNAQLNFNTSKAALGQLGVVSALSTGNTYAPGEQQVIYLDFVVAPTVRSSVNLSFGNGLGIVREVADTNANSLTVAWQGKSLGVILPPLQIGTDNGPSGKTLKFSWPQAAGSTVLEESDSLIAPNWTPVQQSPTPVNGNNELTIPTDGRQRFYRLKTQ